MMSIKKGRGKMRTKKQRIKEHLEAGNVITQRDAYQLFNHTRLAAVIHELRNETKTFRLKLGMALEIILNYCFLSHMNNEKFLCKGDLHIAWPEACSATQELPENLNRQHIDHSYGDFQQH